MAYNVDEHFRIENEPVVGQQVKTIYIRKDPPLGRVSRGNATKTTFRWFLPIVNIDDVMEVVADNIQEEVPVDETENINVDVNEGVVVVGEGVENEEPVNINVEVEEAAFTLSIDEVNMRLGVIIRNHHPDRGLLSLFLQASGLDTDVNLDRLGELIGEDMKIHQFRQIAVRLNVRIILIDIADYKTMSKDEKLKRDIKRVNFRSTRTFTP